MELTKGELIAGEVNRLIQKMIAGYLATDRRRLVVGETFWDAMPSQGASAPLQHFFCEDELYFFLAGSAPKAGLPLNLYLSGRWYPSIWALTTVGADEAPLVSGQRVTEAALGAMAARTTLIGVGIYDEESYLLWDRG
jgi:hypothetical protein